MPARVDDRRSSSPTNNPSFTQRQLTMTPLAERMRPRDLSEFVGQAHLVGEGAVLRQATEAGKIPSFILWGPPGVGKTTLARLIAQQLKKPFYQLSAIHSGVKDIREAIENAEKTTLFQAKGAILFIDEIHRFSKSQQDALLGAVEKGTVTLIGATTENPSFEVIPALLSRCQVYVLHPLHRDQLELLMRRALLEDEVLRNVEVVLEETEALLLYSGGDARRLLNALELVVTSSPGDQPVRITNAYVREKIQQNIALYDKGGEQHYDVISAFIKSIRGSDPNAAVYWLARMIHGGEDPLDIPSLVFLSLAEGALGKIQLFKGGGDRRAEVPFNLFGIGQVPSEKWNQQGPGDGDRIGTLIKKEVSGLKGRPIILTHPFLKEGVNPPEEVCIGRFKFTFYSFNK